MNRQTTITHKSGRTWPHSSLHSPTTVNVALPTFLPRKLRPLLALTSRPPTASHTLPFLDYTSSYLPFPAFYQIFFWSWVIAHTRFVPGLDPQRNGSILSCFYSTSHHQFFGAAGPREQALCTYHLSIQVIPKVHIHSSVEPHRGPGHHSLRDKFCLPCTMMWVVYPLILPYIHTLVRGDAACCAILRPDLLAIVVTTHGYCLHAEDGISPYTSSIYALLSSVNGSPAVRPKRHINGCKLTAWPFSSRFYCPPLSCYSTSRYACSTLLSFSAPATTALDSTHPVSPLFSQFKIPILRILVHSIQMRGCNQP